MYHSDITRNIINSVIRSGNKEQIEGAFKTQNAAGIRRALDPKRSPNISTYLSSKEWKNVVANGKNVTEVIAESVSLRIDAKRDLIKLYADTVKDELDKLDKKLDEKTLLDKLEMERPVTDVVSKDKYDHDISDLTSKLKVQQEQIDSLEREKQEINDNLSEKIHDLEAAYRRLETKYNSVSSPTITTSPIPTHHDPTMPKIIATTEFSRWSTVAYSHLIGNLIRLYTGKKEVNKESLEMFKSLNGRKLENMFDRPIDQTVYNMAYSSLTWILDNNHDPVSMMSIVYGTHPPSYPTDAPLVHKLPEIIAVHTPSVSKIVNDDEDTEEETEEAEEETEDEKGSKPEEVVTTSSPVVPEPAPIQQSVSDEKDAKPLIEDYTVDTSSKDASLLLDYEDSESVTKTSSSSQTLDSTVTPSDNVNVLIRNRIQNDTNASGTKDVLSLFMDTAKTRNFNQERELMNIDEAVGMDVYKGITEGIKYKDLTPNVIYTNDFLSKIEKLMRTHVKLKDIGMDGPEFTAKMEQYVKSITVKSGILPILVEMPVNKFEKKYSKSELDIHKTNTGLPNLMGNITLLLALGCRFEGYTSGIVFYFIADYLLSSIILSSLESINILKSKLGGIELISNKLQDDIVVYHTHFIIQLKEFIGKHSKTMLKLTSFIFAVHTKPAIERRSNSMGMFKTYLEVVAEYDNGNYADTFSMTLRRYWKAILENPNRKWSQYADGQTKMLTEILEYMYSDVYKKTLKGVWKWAKKS